MSRRVVFATSLAAAGVEGCVPPSLIRDSRYISHQMLEGTKKKFRPFPEAKTQEEYDGRRALVQLLLYIRNAPIQENPYEKNGPTLQDDWNEIVKRINELRYQVADDEKLKKKFVCLIKIS